MNYKDVVIVAYGRSAATRAFKGKFSKMHPVEFGAQVLNGVLEKIPQLDPSEIEDVVVGCAMQFGESSMNVARMIVNRAGLPDSVSGLTINRFCSSGLQSISIVANAIACGLGDVYVAGGVESMSLTINTYPEYNGKCDDLWLKENCPGAYMDMGTTAENVAQKYDISRERMDMFSVDSHSKAYNAQKNGKFTSSIIPVTLTDYTGNKILDENNQPIIVTEDEGIRPETSMETLSNLKACFKEGGGVTAGNSSQRNDCAAFVVLMSKERAEELKIEPLAYLRSFAVAGCDGTLMGEGPIYAVPKALKRADLLVKDIDVFEINEAFAAQAIPCCQVLGFDMNKVNPYGGAIALGHPLGATGAIMVGKVIDYLSENGKNLGLITMCIGGGMGAAAVIEKV